MNIIVSAMSITADARVIIVALLLIAVLLKEKLGKEGRNATIKHQVQHFNVLHSHPLSEEEEKELIQILIRPYNKSK